MQTETTMHTTTDQLMHRQPCYHGLRMTAEEYFQLGETHQRYELIDGVVCMSPSPTRIHQAVLMEIAHQITAYLKTQSVGLVYPEIDVLLGKGPGGRDLAYRPDIAFITNEHAKRSGHYIEGPPALIVEIVSPSSRNLDTRTKKDDYERNGVAEYWIIDPQANEFLFYRLENGKYVQQPTDDLCTSCAIEGFRLDLAAVRAWFK